MIGRDPCPSIPPYCHTQWPGQCCKLSVSTEAQLKLNLLQANSSLLGIKGPLHTNVQHCYSIVSMRIFCMQLSSMTRTKTKIFNLFGDNKSQVFISITWSWHSSGGYPLSQICCLIYIWGFTTYLLTILSLLGLSLVRFWCLFVTKDVKTMLFHHKIGCSHSTHRWPENEYKWAVGCHIALCMSFFFCETNKHQILMRRRCPIVSTEKRAKLKL